MTAHRWVVTKDARCCRNYGCEAYGKRRPGYTENLDAETGGYSYSCPICSKVNVSRLSSYKEQRACEGCSRMRDVTVRRYLSGGESAVRYCDACQAMLAAKSHLKTALRLAAKAHKLYVKHKATVPTWATIRNPNDQG